ncbi:MAG: ABC transporter ATP-binding protein, partial [Proteobacteria bacterium]|nr:ABC transporter ATP-binding protein [Pseudomonadota bacterium]
LGVIGPNGSGKTTTFNLMCGILGADAGRVILDGRDITRLPDYRICRLGLVKTAQIVQPFAGMSVLENVMIAGMFGGGHTQRTARKKAGELLDFVGLGQTADQPAESITVAMRRRLELARCLATDPRVILLDENMAGLTPSEIEEALELLRRIRERGVSLVVVEHVMQAVVGICERIMVLDYGQKIAEGEPPRVMCDKAVIEAYLGEKYA